jgi:hypothetical protein
MLIGLALTKENNPAKNLACCPLTFHQATIERRDIITQLKEFLLNNFVSKISARFLVTCTPKTNEFAETYVLGVF